jgi:CrcB protein
MTVIYVALGGALGSALRYLLGQWLGRIAPGNIPWGTFGVNLLGSFLIGFLMVRFALRGQLDTELRIALTVGVLGGFTTYSAFAYEVVSLVQRKETAAVLTYLGLTFALTFAGCAAGIYLARALR